MTNKHKWVNENLPSLKKTKIFITYQLDSYNGSCKYEVAGIFTYIFACKWCSGGSNRKKNNCSKPAAIAKHNINCSSSSRSILVPVVSAFLSHRHWFCTFFKNFYPLFLLLFPIFLASNLFSLPMQLSFALTFYS